MLFLELILEIKNLKAGTWSLKLRGGEEIWKKLPIFTVVRADHKIWQTVKKLGKLQSNLGSGHGREIMRIIEAGALW